MKINGVEVKNDSYDSSGLFQDSKVYDRYTPKSKNKKQSHIHQNMANGLFKKLESYLSDETYQSIRKLCQQLWNNNITKRILLFILVIEVVPLVFGFLLLLLGNIVFFFLPYLFGMG